MAAQFNKCKTMLDRKVDQLVIHALGRAINRALKLALKLEAAMLHSIKLDVQTGSVTVIPKMGNKFLDMNYLWEFCEYFHKNLDIEKNFDYKNELIIKLFNSLLQVTDDLTSLLDGNESMSRERQVSSVHILLTRIED